MPKKDVLILLLEVYSEKEHSLLMLIKSKENAVCDNQIFPFYPTSLFSLSFSLSDLSVPRLHPPFLSFKTEALIYQDNPQLEILQTVV